MIIKKQNLKFVERAFSCLTWERGIKRKVRKTSALWKIWVHFWLSRNGNPEQTIDRTLLVINQTMSAVKPIRKISSKQPLKLLWKIQRNLKVRLIGLWKLYLVVIQIIQVKTFQTYLMRCVQIAKLPRIWDLTTK